MYVYDCILQTTDLNASFSATADIVGTELLTFHMRMGQNLEPHIMKLDLLGWSTKVSWFRPRAMSLT